MAKKGEMIQGKNKILLFRKYGETEEAAKLVFQTEHTFSYDRDLDAIVTKDGSTIKVGELESEVDIEAIQSQEDPVLEMLEKSIIDGEKLELWEVNVDDDAKDEDDKYPAIYCQGYLESWELTASAEDESEASGTLQIDLKPQFGETSLTDEQQEAVQYAFIETDEVQEELKEDDDGEDTP